MAVMTTLPISRRVALENISCFSVNKTSPTKNIPWVITLRIVARTANFPICPAVLSSLASSEVVYSLITRSDGFLFLAMSVLTPTQRTTALP
jgi:hypothetical protein